MNHFNLPGTGFFIFLMLISAVLGWAVIELILWLFSFVTITFG